jgi:hypothetical protein
LRSIVICFLHMLVDSLGEIVLQTRCADNWEARKPAMGEKRDPSRYSE